jgi:hypothetical protein
MSALKRKDSALSLVRCGIFGLVISSNKSCSSDGFRCIFKGEGIAHHPEILTNFPFYVYLCLPT